MLCPEFSPSQDPQGLGQNPRAILLKRTNLVLAGLRPQMGLIGLELSARPNYRLKTIQLKTWVTGQVPKGLKP